MVMVPPTLAAIARGMSSFDGEILAAWQIPIITGMRQATVPVLEDTEERTMVTSMIAAMSGTWLVPAFLTTATPIASRKACFKHGSADDKHTAEEDYGGVGQTGINLL